mmetsp:Transcript_22885/g.22165  ORF Transcript_22885/g.22165 Transcript_22885/m.22165 type:complete len:175 (+) Transcript_22885:1608-2132(+)
MKSSERLEETFKPKICLVSEQIHRKRMLELKENQGQPIQYYHPKNAIQIKQIGEGSEVRPLQMKSGSLKGRLSMGTIRKNSEEKRFAAKKESRSEMPLQIIDVNREREEFDGLIQKIQEKLSEKKLTQQEFKSIACLLLGQELSSEKLHKANSQETAYIGSGEESLKEYCQEVN